MAYWMRREEFGNNSCCVQNFEHQVFDEIPHLQEQLHLQQTYPAYHFSPPIDGRPLTSSYQPSITPPPPWQPPLSPSPSGQPLHNPTWGEGFANICYVQNLNCQVFDELPHLQPHYEPNMQQHYSKDFPPHSEIQASQPSLYHYYPPYDSPQPTTSYPYSRQVVTSSYSPLPAPSVSPCSRHTLPQSYPQPTDTSYQITTEERITEDKLQQENFIKALDLQWSEHHQTIENQMKEYQCEKEQRWKIFENQLQTISQLVQQISSQHHHQAELIRIEVPSPQPFSTLNVADCERRNQLINVLEQIQNMSNEIHGSSWSRIVLDEGDLSLKRLEELHIVLLSLQKEKNDRLRQVLELRGRMKSLCSVLGLAFKQTVNEIYPSLVNNSEETNNYSHDAIQRLTTIINHLVELKLHRMQRLQDLATSMLELWNLMDTPIEEQQNFQHVTCKITASEHEIEEPNMLSLEFIDNVELEVSRLDKLKANKIKELVLKQMTVLEEICRKIHLTIEPDVAVEVAIKAIESGAMDPACVLEQIGLRIAKVNEEACSRKEIVEKVEKWLGACQQKCWLEKNNNDDNRYNAGRGAHLIMKRAEKARILVNKLPRRVEALALRATSWEKEMGIQFSYDGIRLLSMLEEYVILRHEKYFQRKREQDKKKLEAQSITEQEALFGSKPSPMKLQTGKKGRKVSTSGAPNNRRFRLGGPMPPKTMDVKRCQSSSRVFDRGKESEHKVAEATILTIASHSSNNYTKSYNRKPRLMGSQVSLTTRDYLKAFVYLEIYLHLEDKVYFKGLGL